MLVACYFLFSVFKVYLFQIYLSFSLWSIHPSSAKPPLTPNEVYGGGGAKISWGVTSGGITWTRPQSIKVCTNDPQLRPIWGLQLAWFVYFCTVGGNQRTQRWSFKLKNITLKISSWDHFYEHFHGKTVWRKFPSNVFLNSHTGIVIPLTMFTRTRTCDGWKTLECILTEVILKWPLVLQPRAEFWMQELLHTLFYVKSSLAWK